jgi:hypothetical protein
MHVLQMTESTNEDFSDQEYLWCQELAATLDPFSVELLTPRQKLLLQHFQWESLVGIQGYELTQLILQKLHKKSQTDNELRH